MTTKLLARVLTSALIAALAFFASTTYAQISLTGTFYSENFDSMGTNAPSTTTPAGWFVGTVGNGTNGFVSGTSVSTSDGTSGTGSNYNFGVAGVNPITDRALGSIAANSTSNRVTEVRFTNNTGSTITNLSIIYDGEQWRDGGTAGNPSALTMFFSADGFSFTPLGAAFTFTSLQDGSTPSVLDGNASTNRVAGITGNSATNIDNGVTFYLRWLDLNDPGNDDGLAVDNFSLTVSVMATSTTNSWIGADGFWESLQFWSLSTAPSLNDSADLITNAGNNTVSIDAFTTNLPGTLTISNLTITANTLRLTDAGTNVPLRVLQALRLTSNATVIVSNSALRSDTTIQVGSDGPGNQLNITSGGQVTSSNGSIGAVNFLGNTNNTALVTDPSSVWTLSGALDIGLLSGGNQLIISNGAKVASQAAAVGDSPGASTNGAPIDNSILVTGTNSLWINTAQVTLNRNNGGSVLTIADGGAFASSGNVAIGTSAASGGNIVLVTDPGSTWTNTGQLGVGGFGVANQFVVSNGATAYSGNSVIGGNTGIFSNAAVVTDPGSIWIVGSAITIGDSGTGSSLTVTNGGLILAQDEFLAGSGGAGALIIAGGTNIVDNQIRVGFNGGTGTVSVLDGALFVTNSTATASVQVYANSTLIIGAGTFKADSLVVTNGGGVQYNLTYQVDNGTVTVAGGSVQAGSNLVIAATTGSTGTVIVVGGTLVATNGPFSVGNDGTITSGGGVGKVTVSNGTLLAATILLGSSAGGLGDLTLANGGSISCPGGSNCLIAINSLGFDQIGGTLTWVGGTCEIGVTAAGDYNVSGGSAVFDDLYAGYGNVGTMTMAGGVANINSRLIIGHLGSPVATGTVWMTGGQLTVLNNYTIIGNSGVGRFTISNGTMTATSVFVGNSSNPGSLTVAGGTLTALTGVTVGDCGGNMTGIVTVTGGNMFVTNAAHNATLDVRSGTLTFSSGFVKVDNLVLTNACGRFFHTGGTLQYSQLVLDPSLSAAGDGIPNSWKQQYGLDPFDPNLANEDADGDGVSNLREYQLGTDPTVSSSPFRITAIAREANNIRITWVTIGGMTNMVQVTAGTANGSYTNTFSDLGSQLIIPGVSVTTTNYLDTNAATNSPARYYRIRVVP